MLTRKYVKLVWAEQVSLQSKSHESSSSYNLQCWFSLSKQTIFCPYYLLWACWVVLISVLFWWAEVTSCELAASCESCLPSALVTCSSESSPTAGPAPSASFCHGAADALKFFLMCSRWRISSHYPQTGRLFDLAGFSVSFGPGQDGLVYISALWFSSLDFTGKFFPPLIYFLQSLSQTCLVVLACTSKLSLYWWGFLQKTLSLLTRSLTAVPPLTSSSPLNWQKLVFSGNSLVTLFLTWIKQSLCPQRSDRWSIHTLNNPGAFSWTWFAQLL